MNPHKRRRKESEGEDLAPSACDQCRLRKVRCDRKQPECSNCCRSGVSCSSSHTAKRINHFKELRDEFAVVLERLGDFDQSLKTLTELTHQVASRSCHHGPSSNDVVTVPDPPKVDSPPHEDRLEAIEVDGGGELSYGYPAPLFLARSLLKRVEDAVVGPELGGSQQRQIAPAVRQPNIQNFLRRKRDQFPCSGPCPQSTVSTDHKPIATPPRLLIDSCVEGYLTNINTSIPVFEATDLHHAIDAHYEGKQAESHDSWALILNNIVLLELGLQTQLAHASRVGSAGIFDDLIPKFMRNCDRAISNLDAYNSPCLVNVQALLTLILVTREFYHNSLFERVCQVACQLGHVMGLHQKRHPFPSPEAERLYKVLYSLDKQRAFITGQPCNMYSFESDLQVTIQAESNELDMLEATTGIMSIWEEIYLSLYSSKSKNVSHLRRSSQSLSILDTLEQWNRRFCNAQTPMDSRTRIGSPHLKMELQYYYHTTAVLILRISNEVEAASKQLREHCRGALNCIIELGDTTSLSTFVLASLARVFRSSPVVAFMELTSSHLMAFVDQGLLDDDAHRDIEVLRGVCQRLEVLQNASFPRSYYNRVQLGMSWAASVLEGLEDALKPPALLGFDVLNVASNASSEGLDPNHLPATPSDYPAPFSSLGGHLLRPTPNATSSAEHFLETTEQQLVGEISGSSFLDFTFTGSSDASTNFVRSTCLQSAWDAAKE